MKFAKIEPRRTSRDMTDAFYGYNHKLKIRRGEFYNTQNLTTAYFPMLANRNKRSTYKQLTSPGGIIEKDALAYVDNGALFYNGTVTPINSLTEGEKQLVSMGAYICIFPDKVYYNTADPTDFGSMEADYSSLGSISYTLCKVDGSEYDTAPTMSDEEPADPVNNQLWIDTSGDMTLMQYSSSAGMWSAVTSVYTKIKFTSQGEIPRLFSTYDGVEISGAQFEDANGSHILYLVGGEENKSEDFVVIVGLLPMAFEQTAGAVRIQRKLPNLNFVCECQNRLWGCFYGNDGKKNLNEIYCSALGDFKNWSQFLGLSTDSWTGSVGSDGMWTGAVNYLGYPTFFKENIIHRVTISAVGAHSIAETPCRGVQKGSHKSLQVVNETLYYKSRSDVCAWQGGFPDSVSDALGDVRYYDAVAGTHGDKYYISMRDLANKWHLFCFDIAKGIWIREDNLQALQFAKVDDELFCVNAQTYELIGLNGIAGEPEGMVEWMAETGMQYYEYPDKKYLSRYNLRLKMEEGAELRIYIQYDSMGEYVQEGKVVFQGTGTVTVPIKPRRCDHLKMRLEGHGEFRLFSIAKILEIGSDK